MTIYDQEEAMGGQSLVYQARGRSQLLTGLILKPFNCLSVTIDNFLIDPLYYNSSNPISTLSGTAAAPLLAHTDQHRLQRWSGRCLLYKI